MNDNVLVIMPTYNAQCWIDEQIRSIISQSHVNVVILVYDDFSTDNTPLILKKYAEKYSCIKIVASASSAPFRNPALSFFFLINESLKYDYDYLALSDHDDIWLPNKLFNAITAIAGKSFSGFSSDVFVYKQCGSTFKTCKSKPFRKWDYLFESSGPGCTFVLDRKLAFDFSNILLRNEAKLQEVYMHDLFIYAFARSRGAYWYIDPCPSILYRQHANNYLGSRDTFKVTYRRLCDLFSGKYRLGIIRMISMLDLNLPPQMYRSLLSKHYIVRLQLIFYVTEFRRSLKDKLYLFLLIIFGILR